MRRLIVLSGFLMLASCAHSLPGLDTTGKVHALPGCTYERLPPDVKVITAQSPNSAVLPPGAAKRAAVVVQGACSGREGYQVVTLTPDGAPAMDPASNTMAQKYRLDLVNPKDW